jgi:hypothetical protein
MKMQIGVWSWDICWGWDGMGWDGMGWDGMGRGGMGYGPCFGSSKKRREQKMGKQRNEHTPNNTETPKLPVQNDHTAKILEGRHAKNAQGQLWDVRRVGDLNLFISRYDILYTFDN